MASKALSVQILDINSASRGIDGGTGCNFMYFRVNIVCSERCCTRIIIQFGEISSEETDTVFS